MNGRKAKQIRAHVDTLSVAWIQGLLSEEEAAKVNKDNYKASLPKKPYVYLKQAVRLNAFHPRWRGTRIPEVLVVCFRGLRRETRRAFQTNPL